MSVRRAEFGPYTRPHMERSATDPRESPFDGLHAEAQALLGDAAGSPVGRDPYPEMHRDEPLRRYEPRRTVHLAALTRERAALLAAPFQVRSRRNGGIVARRTIPTGGEEVG